MSLGKTEVREHLKDHWLPTMCNWVPCQKHLIITVLDNLTVLDGIVRAEFSLSKQGIKIMVFVYGKLV